MALEDRFEVLKDIGDGSFGSVVLARVRSAGSSVARRGTVVRQYDLLLLRLETDFRILDCDQVDEEKLRILCALLRTSRSCVPQNPSSTSTSRSGIRYFSRPFQQETPYLYGVYGW